MNSSKLIDIFRNGNIVIPLFLLKRYKKLKLELSEFVFLMYLYSCGEKILFDPNLFSNQLGLDLSEIMNYISILSEKKIIRVEVLKNEKGLMEEYVLLEDFYQKLMLLTIDEFNTSSSVNSNNNEDYDINVFELVEKEFCRTLSPIEYEIIKAWLDSGYSTDLIKEAIKEATFNGVSNLRYIDKILYEWGKAGLKTVNEVEEIRKRRNKKAKEEPEIDIDIVDWNWFDEDE